MHIKNGLKAAAIACWAGVSACAQTGSADLNAGAGGPFARDRAAILAMAGNYHVRFDMRETVPFLADYTVLPAKVANGHEAVRVVEDTGTTIRLQHLLVVSDNGKSVVVKHWRQDWVYEPRDVLVYETKDHWRLKPLAARERLVADRVADRRFAALRRRGSLEI